MPLQGHSVAYWHSGGCRFNSKIGALDTPSRHPGVVAQQSCGSELKKQNWTSVDVIGDVIAKSSLTEIPTVSLSQEYIWHYSTWHILLFGEFRSIVVHWCQLEHAAYGVWRPTRLDLGVFGLLDQTRPNKFTAPNTDKQFFLVHQYPSRHP